MKNVGPTFFWVLGGIPLAGSDRPFEYYVIPSEEHGQERLSRTQTAGYLRQERKVKHTTITRCAPCIFRLTNLPAAGIFQSIAIDGI